MILMLRINLAKPRPYPAKEKLSIAYNALKQRKDPLVEIAEEGLYKRAGTMIQRHKWRERLAKKGKFSAFSGVGLVTQQQLSVIFMEKQSKILEKLKKARTYLSALMALTAATPGILYLSSDSSPSKTVSILVAIASIIATIYTHFHFKHFFSLKLFVTATNQNNVAKNLLSHSSTIKDSETRKTISLIAKNSAKVCAGRP